MAFRNTLLEKIVEMPNLSGHWLCNFNTLGDKNESVTETNKIAALPPPNPPPPHFCDFPILWDKSCAGYKNALKKKLVSVSIPKEITLKYFKNSSKTKKVTLQTFL